MALTGLPNPVQKWVNYMSRGSGADASAAAYDQGKSVDVGQGLYSLMKSQQGYDPSQIEADPLYKLALQKADELYPTGGGGDGGLNQALAQAAAKYAYGGPSIDQINAYGAAGQSRISNLYSELSNYVNAQKGDTANRFNQGIATTNAAYDEAAKNIAAQQAANQQNIQQQGATGGSAAASAGAGQAAMVADAYARQNAINATNKANAASNLQTLSTGHQGILADLAAGEQNERGLQSGRLQDQVSGLIAKATAEMANAKQNQAMAQQSIRDKYAAAQADAANKNAAARTQALEDAVKRIQKGQGQGDNLSGMQGVLNYALRANRPDLAKKFLDMFGAAGQLAAQQNQKAANDPSGLTKKTTAEDQLQLLMGNVGKEMGDRFNLADKNLDLYRGDFIKEIQNNPALASLKKYIVSNPEQAKQLGLYQPAFGVSQEKYNEIPGQKGLFGYEGPLSDMDRWTGLGQSKDLGQKTRDIHQKQWNAQFTPFVNIDALRQNQGDINTYYGAYGNTGDQDMMSALYNIFKGKYGKGGL